MVVVADDDDDDEEDGIGELGVAYGIVKKSTTTSVWR